MQTWIRVITSNFFVSIENSSVEATSRKRKRDVVPRRNVNPAAAATRPNRPLHKILKRAGPAARPIMIAPSLYVTQPPQRAPPPLRPLRVAQPLRVPPPLRSLATPLQVAPPLSNSPAMFSQLTNLRGPGQNGRALSRVDKTRLNRSIARHYNSARPLAPASDGSVPGPSLPYSRTQNTSLFPPPRQRQQQQRRRQLLQQQRQLILHQQKQLLTATPAATQSRMDMPNGTGLLSIRKSRHSPLSIYENGGDHQLGPGLLMKAGRQEEEGGWPPKSEAVVGKQVLNSGQQQWIMKQEDVKQEPLRKVWYAIEC